MTNRTPTRALALPIRPRTETEPGRRRRWVHEAATVLPPVVILAVLLEVATRRNTGHLELLGAVLAVALTQVVPGALVWRAVRPRDGWLVEDLVLGLAVGAAVAVPSQMAAAGLSASWLAWAIPVGLSVVLLAVPASRSRVTGARWSALPVLWTAALSLAFLLPIRQLIVVAFRQPVRWSGWESPYVDLPYHLALVGQALHHFPPHYPQLALDPLQYHWFAHAWMAHVASVSGTSTEVVLLRFVPTLFAVAVPLATAIVAVRITRLVWAGPVAGLVVFAVGGFDVWGVVSTPLPLTPLSPTLSFGVLVLAALLTLLVARWRGETQAGSGLLLLLLLVVAGGSKGTVLPVLLLGCLFASGAALLWRTRHRWRTVLDTALVALVLVGLVVFLFGGGASGMALEPFASVTQSQGPRLLGVPAEAVTGGLAVSAVLGTLLLHYSATLPGLGSMTNPRTGRDPATWLLVGCTCAGAGAILAFQHPGLGQWYFQFVALLPAGVLAAWGGIVLVSGLPRPRVLGSCGVATGVLAVLAAPWLSGLVVPRSPGLYAFWVPIVVFLCTVLAVSVVCAALFARGSGRAATSVVALLLVSCAAAGLVPAYKTLAEDPPEPAQVTRETPGAIHSSEIRAARWIRTHSDPTARVMTNRHCRNADRDPCGHETFFVSAYSEREVLIEGWAYNKTANSIAKRTGQDGRTLPFWDPQLLELNDGFITDPSAAAARALYELGVRWVYVSHRAPHAEDLAPFAERRMSTRQATVYRLNPPSSDR